MSRVHFFFRFFAVGGGGRTVVGGRIHRNIPSKGPTPGVWNLYLWLRLAAPCKGGVRPLVLVLSFVLGWFKRTAPLRVPCDPPPDMRGHPWAVLRPCGAVQGGRGVSGQELLIPGGLRGQGLLQRGDLPAAPRVKGPVRSGPFTAFFFCRFDLSTFR